MYNIINYINYRASHSNVSLFSKILVAVVYACFLKLLLVYWVGINEKSIWFWIILFSLTIPFAILVAIW